MSYRIIYKKVFEKEKDARSAEKELGSKASHPMTIQGKSGGWLVILYESDRLSKIEEGLKYYRANGLTVFYQKVG